jgi:hypothetical protein
MRHILFFIGLCVPLFVGAQNAVLQKWVTSTGGSYATNGNYSHLATVGQTSASRFDVLLRNGTIGFINDEDVILGLSNNIALMESLSVYPNPSSSFFTIRNSALSEGKSSLSVIDAQGKQISFRVEKYPDRWEVYLDCSAGVYFLMLQSPNDVLTKRIVKF